MSHEQTISEDTASDVKPNISIQTPRLRRQYYDSEEKQNFGPSYWLYKQNGMEAAEKEIWAILEFLHTF